MMILHQHPSIQHIASSPTFEECGVKQPTTGYVLVTDRLQCSIGKPKAYCAHEQDECHAAHVNHALSRRGCPQNRATTKTRRTRRMFFGSSCPSCSSWLFQDALVGVEGASRMRSCAWRCHSSNR
jgi:hypothetical protein